MTIHGEHPFAVPEGERDPLRRLRGRLAAPVTVWGSGAGEQRTASTVAATLVAEPELLVGLVGADGDLAARLRSTGAFTVAVLGADQRDLADEAAGVRPAPGGVFRTQRWLDTPFGPVPAAVSGWAGCRVQRTEELGWQLLVVGQVAQVELSEPQQPLVWWRGGYRTLASG